MLNSTASRLCAFAAGLTVAGGGAAGIGSITHATPPLQDCLKVAAARAGFDTGMTGAGAEAMAEPVPGADGRRSELAGITLRPAPTTFAAGTQATWRFRLAGCDGKPVRKLEPENGKLLHLIVVRTDLTAYQHLHPRMQRDGTWSVQLATPQPGRYRAIADFVVDGRKYVLGTTFTAPGSAPQRPLPAPSLQASADGYQVELQRPAELRAGEEDQLTFRITRGGRPVRSLQPYLGAYGHLVALHAPEAAYSHVHPAGEDRRSGLITFNTEFHQRGAFRLFLQFQVAGRVHTAEFTQEVS
jgi:hypothetical protein